MKTIGLLLLVMVGCIIVSASATNARAKETASSRIIPIPKREHGYSNFESTVITSQDDLDSFLPKKSKGKDMGWNSRKDFEKAIAEANLDFEREALVLLRHTEGSGSVQITFRESRLIKDKLVCQIDRKEPGMGTADMAYYCFALAVVKTDVTQVELKVAGRKPVILSLKKESSNKPDAGAGK
jgi:hypothetical protein